MTSEALWQSPDAIDNKIVRAPESHRRESVDCSGPAYQRDFPFLRIPPTAVGGLFRSRLPNRLTPRSQIKSLDEG
jgi:hypothetical protein